MGLFDIFKRKKTYIIDFCSINDNVSKRAYVSFNDKNIIIDDKEYDFNEYCEYVREGGLSSDNLYYRVFTDKISFWVSPHDYSSFLKEINKIYTNSKPKKILYESISKYDETADLKYNWSGNVLYVTGLYFTGSAQTYIKKLNINDTLKFVIFEEKPDEIAVFTNDGHQIGLYAGAHYELLIELIKSQTPIYVFVEDTGIIPDKNIAWLHIRTYIYK